MSATLPCSLPVATQLVTGARRGCREGCTSHVPAIRQGPPACFKSQLWGWLTWPSHRVFCGGFALFLSRPASAASHLHRAVGGKAVLVLMPAYPSELHARGIGGVSCLPAPCPSRTAALSLWPWGWASVVGSFFFLFFFKPKTLNSALTARTSLDEDTLGPTILLV